MQNNIYIITTLDETDNDVNKINLIIKQIKLLEINWLFSENDYVNDMETIAIVKY